MVLIPAVAGGSLGLSLRNMVETLAISVPTVVDGVRGTVSRQVCDDRLESWSGKVVDHLGMKIEVSGRENLARDRTFLVMSNHQSHYDVPVLFHVVGPPHGASLRMIAKIELFKFPFFGRAMLEAGFHLHRSRKSPSGDREPAPRERADALSGINVWIAPEGSRGARPASSFLSRKAAFISRSTSAEPILPITIDGTRTALPRGSSVSYRGANVRVVIHKPMSVAAYDRNQKGFAALSEDVRTVIASGFG